MLKELIHDIIIVRILFERGLDFLFNKVEGYDRGLYVEFYRNMKVVASDTINNKVRGKDIMINQHNRQLPSLPLTYSYSNPIP